MYEEIYIYCYHCGKTPISHADYMKQLIEADSRWKHTLCGSDADFAGVFYPCPKCGLLLDSCDGSPCERCHRSAEDEYYELALRPDYDLTSNHDWPAPNYRSAIEGSNR